MVFTSIAHIVKLTDHDVNEDLQVIEVRKFCAGRCREDDIEKLKHQDFDDVRFFSVHVKHQKIGEATDTVDRVSPLRKQAFENFIFFHIGRERHHHVLFIDEKQEFELLVGNKARFVFKIVLFQIVVIEAVIGKQVGDEGWD